MRVSARRGWAGQKNDFLASCSDIWNLPINWSQPGIGKISVDVDRKSVV